MAVPSREAPLLHCVSVVAVTNIRSGIAGRELARTVDFARSRTHKRPKTAVSQVVTPAVKKKEV